MLRKLVQKNLKRLREEAKLSQVDLSGAAEINLRFFNRAENSDEGLNLTLDTLERISKGLDCSPHELLAPLKTKQDKSVTEVEKAIKILEKVKKDISSKAHK